MRSYCYFSRYFALYFTLLLPAVSGARPLPMGSFYELLQPGYEVAERQMVMIPLAIHTVLYSSEVVVGRRQFFRVTEDVVIADTLMFGAGAVAAGYIRSIERAEAGQITAIGIELVHVQAAHGGRVTLTPKLVWVKIQKTDTQTYIISALTGILQPV